MPARLARHFKNHDRAGRLWRLAITLNERGVPILPKLLLNRVRSRFGADLPLLLRRPSELYLMHNGLGTVIHPDTTFTGPTILFHQVTLGNSWTAGPDEGTPTLGSYVFVGAGAKLLGKIHVGDYVVIAANSVITHDVPSCTVVTPDGQRSIAPETVKRVYFAYGRV